MVLNCAVYYVVPYQATIFQIKKNMRESVNIPTKQENQIRQLIKAWRHLSFIVTVAFSLRASPILQLILPMFFYLLCFLKGHFTLVK